MKMEKWWKKHFRMIQYNLQVKDTPLMDPEQIARDTEELNANVVVMNVGGIYAWYPTKVPYHYMNEFLPEGRDLIKELVESMHARGIRFVARFDFNMAMDEIYLKRPWWFVADPDKSPSVAAPERMGGWPQLLRTCSNSGYRNEEVAVPVLQEVLRNYDVDGIFLNSPAAHICYCEKCQEKYYKKYGTCIPEDSKAIAPDWKDSCMKDNMDVLYKGIKEIREDVPFMLYYFPFQWSGKEIGRNQRDNIYKCYETADIILTEGQNVLSAGVDSLRETDYPLMAVKAGQLADESVPPLGMIHACPGTDWRHVGLPAAEFKPWMCQIPAFGGNLWSLITGFAETTYDKRLLGVIRDTNAMVKKIESDMDDAKSYADVCLVWDGSPSSQSWVDILLSNHVTFDLMQDYHLLAELLDRYNAVVIPETLAAREDVMNMAFVYVKQGGHLLVETRDGDVIENYSSLLGTKTWARTSEFLYASYLRIEDPAYSERLGTDLMVLRGPVIYTEKNDNTQILSTLIPPFSPLKGAGAPPERASLPMPATDIPLILENAFGKGQVISILFPLSVLVKDYRMPDHYELVSYLLDKLINQRKLTADITGTVYISEYKKENELLIHLVNETGTRPLKRCVPVYNSEVSVEIPAGFRVKQVAAVLEDVPFEWTARDHMLQIRLGRLDVWQMLKIQLEEE